MAVRILVVEDEEIAARDLCLTVERLGYQIASRARTCQEAVELSESSLPDAVLLDLSLKDSPSRINALSRLTRRLNIPHILLGTTHRDVQRAKARNALPAAFVFKPYRDADLAAAIEIAIRSGDKKRKRRPPKGLSLDEMKEFESVKKKLDRETGFVSLLGSIASIANTSREVPEALQNSINVICDFAKWPLGHALVRDPIDPASFLSTGIWHQCDRRHFKTIQRRTEGYQFVDGFPLHVANNNRPIWIPDIFEAIAVRRGREFWPTGVTSCFGMPIRIVDEVIAVLEFFSPDPIEPDERFLEVCEQIGTQLGRVFERELNNRNLRMALEKEHEARALAEKAVTEREEFIAVTTHELNSPAGIVQMSLESLERAVHLGSKGEIQERLLIDRVDRALLQSRRMTYVLRRLLEFSWLSSGKIDLTRTEFDLSQLVRECLDSRTEELSALNTPITTVLKSGVRGEWDKFRIQQVFDNLLSNSLKYGDGDAIRIEVREDEDNAVLTVKDSGEGIPLEAQKRIFERFVRVGKDSYAHSGLGLGLYIVKNIVQAHNGRLEFESTPGAGTTFLVRLPKKPAAQSKSHSGGEEQNVVKEDRDHVQYL